MSNARTLASLIDGSNIVVPSGGINFSDIQTAASGTTSEILDGYEEGTWTPTYVTDAGNLTTVTYHTSVTGGKYIKVGNLVYASGTLYTLSGTSITGATGVVGIGNLPFTVGASSNAQNGYTTVMIGETAGFTGDHPTMGRAVPSTTRSDLFTQAAANGASSSVIPSDLNTGNNANLLRFTIIYVSS